VIAKAFAQAQQYHRAGAFAQAAAVYRQILEIDPANAPALFQLGAAYEALGELPKAADCFRRLASLEPRQADVYYRLGTVLFRQGQLAEAAEAIEHSLRLRPGLAEAHTNLGVVLHAQGQWERAIACYRRALSLGPDHPVVRNYLGVALKEHGQLQEAIACFQRALQLKPDYAEAYNNLGTALRSQGDLPGAVAAHRQALWLDPAYAEAYHNLGVALEGQGHAHEAVACYRRSLQIKPNNPGACINLGHALYDQKDLEGAGAAYRQALSLLPDCADAHHGLTYVLEDQGRAEEAVGHALEAIRLRPDWAQPLFALAELAANGYCQFPEDLVQRIQTLLGDPNLSLADASLLHFALALVREKAGTYDEAFDSYRQGNAAQHRLLHETGRAFDPDKHDQFIDQLIATFTPALLERTRSFGLDAELPVFIVGMPRSGTTLVEHILACHPQVFGAGELDEVSRLVAGLPARLGATEDYPQCAARLDQRVARAMAQDYLQELSRRGGQAARVTDKAPLTYLHLGLLAVLFPRARVIHCRRDPRDVCVSCYFQYFRRADFAWDLGDLGRYYRAYERLMEHWRAVLPVEMLDVVYEDLVAHQEDVSRRLVAFCGLPWDDRCLTFYESRRPVQTASKLQVRRPIYTTSVGRWRRYEAHLGPLLEALGLG
jgi:tetratricopeptide (TPR) repeat protein